jgi:hypothetical protein
MALRLDAKMRAHLLQGRLQVPTRDEPAEDRGGRRSKVGAEKSRWFVLTAPGLRPTIPVRLIMR